jgi:hypothetical protein
MAIIAHLGDSMVGMASHRPADAPPTHPRGVHLLDILRPARRTLLPRITTFLVVALAIALAPAPSRAAYMMPGTPLRPKDFAIVKQDGYYHLFYILNSAVMYPDQTENSFGHAISADLYNWTQLPPVLHVSAQGWDNLHVWAPSIVKQDGLWWMMYTGVTADATHNRTQRMGLAVSADLNNWTRVDTPVFDAKQAPWVWSDPTKQDPAFRDPFVMPDPQHPGGWLMYYTASYGADSAAMVVGLARSSGNLHTWTDAGPLLVTWRGYTFNAVTESPHMIQRNGLWYLFITTNSSQAISLYTNTDPTGPLWTWAYRGRLRSVIGVDTGTWYASEGLVDGDRQLFAFVNGDRIELREMMFGSSWTFSLVQPQYFHVMKFDWASPSLFDGDTTSFSVRVVNPASGRPVLQSFLVNAAGVETPVAPESLGLALPSVMNADTIRVPWIARRWPPVSVYDTSTVTRIRVRTQDNSVASAVLSVRGRPIPPGPFYAQDPPLIPDPTPVLPTVYIRGLHHTPLATSAALAVGVDHAAPARVDIYDVLGRRVRNLAQRELPAGVTVLAWDGRDQSGAQVQRGVYFARLVTGDHTLTTRLLLLDH